MRRYTYKSRKIVRRLLQESMLKLISAWSQGEKTMVGEKYFGDCERDFGQQLS